MSLWACHIGALVLALALDRLIGDPDRIWRRLPHPVVIVGAAIARLEVRLNVGSASARQRRRRGLCALTLLCGAGAATGLLLEAAFGAIPLGVVAEAAVASVLLAQKGLGDHARAVADRLDAEGVPGGRAAVAMIVGRDVSGLDESGVARAAIESTSENFSDGVVAPALWFALLGLPGLFVFKIASTADSMIGHRSLRYAHYGWAAARLDDVLNIVPARLSALLIAAAALATGRNARQAVRVSLRDARSHRSPNAGWPEAAAAGALGLALGGPRRYGADEVAGAWLNGAGRRTADSGDIRAAIRLVDMGWAIAAAIALAALVLTWLAR